MTYRNDVHYTTWNETLRIHVEHVTTLYRDRVLSALGAERIINADRGPEQERAAVVRVDAIRLEN